MRNYNRDARGRFAPGSSGAASGHLPRVGPSGRRPMALQSARDRAARGLRQMRATLRAQVGTGRTSQIPKRPTASMPFRLRADQPGSGLGAIRRHAAKSLRATRAIGRGYRSSAARARAGARARHAAYTGLGMKKTRYGGYE